MVENKRLLEASTCNQKETKSTKINLQDNISLLNNILGELRAEGKTPQGDMIAAHTSTIGEQVGTLQELVTTLKANQADSIREAVEGAVSYVLAKLKARDPNLNASLQSTAPLLLQSSRSRFRSVARQGWGHEL